MFYLVHPNYFFFQKNIIIDEFPYDINTLASIVVNFRIFSIIVFLIEISRFYGLRVSRVLDIYAIKDKFSLRFAIKCLFKQNGLKTVLLLLVIGLVILSFLSVNIHRIKNFDDNFLGELYEIVITMTTVGYGDMKLDTMI